MAPASSAPDAARKGEVLVRHEAHTAIPDTVRKNEGGYSWVASLPGGESQRGQEQTGKRGTPESVVGRDIRDPHSMGKARLPEL